LKSVKKNDEKKRTNSCQEEFLWSQHVKSIDTNMKQKDSSAYALKYA